MSSPTASIPNLRALAESLEQAALEVERVRDVIVQQPSSEIVVLQDDSGESTPISEAYMDELELRWVPGEATFEEAPRPLVPRRSIGDSPESSVVSYDAGEEETTREAEETPSEPDQEGACNTIARTYNGDIPFQVRTGEECYCNWLPSLLDAQRRTLPRAPHDSGVCGRTAVKEADYRTYRRDYPTDTYCIPPRDRALVMESWNAFPRGVFVEYEKRVYVALCHESKELRLESINPASYAARVKLYARYGDIRTEEYRDVRRKVLGREEETWAIQHANVIVVPAGETGGRIDATEKGIYEIHNLGATHDYHITLEPVEDRRRLEHLFRI